MVPALRDCRVRPNRSNILRSRRRVLNVVGISTRKKLSSVGLPRGRHADKRYILWIAGVESGIVGLINCFQYQRPTLHELAPLLYEILWCESVNVYRAFHRHHGGDEITRRARRVISLDGLRSLRKTRADSICRCRRGGAAIDGTCLQNDGETK